MVTWDDDVQMWLAEAADRAGKPHRKWFHRKESAEKWAES